ncbi:uncharacterized protein KZ484_021871 isoform 2-T2 [Pholidichthys leucotaenia]
MSVLNNLRDFVRERLTAAAEEILSQFEKTIIQYEEVIDNQRRLLENSWSPRINPDPAVSQQHVSKEEELPAGQPLSNQEEPESSQIKEEQQELCTGVVGKQLELKQEADAFIVTLPYGESDDSGPGKNNSHLLSLPAESQDEDGSQPINSLPEIYNIPTLESYSSTYAEKKLVKCDICGKSFKFRSHMMQHYRTHTSQKPYACTICGRRFIQSGLLSIHMRTHTGERPYSCKWCGKSFRQNGNLIAHVRIHTGEKPYHCNMCGRRFTELSSLKRHTLIHTGERPYSCQICGKSFNRRSTLNVHMRTHTRDGSVPVIQSVSHDLHLHLA